MENLPLVLDFLSWVDARDRTYEEAMAIWRTSCPRLTIWEDAVDLHLVQLSERRVTITPGGRTLLHKHRRH